MSILDTGLTLAQARDEFLNREMLGKYGLEFATGELPVLAASRRGHFEAEGEVLFAMTEDISLDEISPEEAQAELDIEVPSAVEPAPREAEPLEAIEAEVELATLLEEKPAPNLRLFSQFGQTPITERLNDKSAAIVECLLDMEILAPQNAYPEVLVSTTLVELGLENVLAQPTMQVIPEIIEAQKRHNRRYKTETMEKWAMGQIETSLGITIMLLCGIRWALRQGSLNVHQFVSEHFEAGYQILVLDSGLTKALETIRTNYRNPAHHGRQVYFSRSDYETLANLAIAFTKVHNWLKCTGTPCSADIGVLHNHLLLRR